MIADSVRIRRLFGPAPSLLLTEEAIRRAEATFVREALAARNERIQRTFAIGHEHLVPAKPTYSGSVRGYDPNYKDVDWPKRRSPTKGDVT